MPGNNLSKHRKGNVEEEGVPRKWEVTTKV